MNKTLRAVGVLLIFASIFGFLGAGFGARAERDNSLLAPVIITAIIGVSLFGYASRNERKKEKSKLPKGGIFNQIISGLLLLIQIFTFLFLGNFVLIFFHSSLKDGILPLWTISPILLSSLFIFLLQIARRKFLASHSQ